MAPNHGYVLTDVSGEPVSRTYQYRKVMKPMLERKRRARINRCLDELKDLMTGALQTEGENVAKLEKADILELTVRHLHKLRRQNEIVGVRPDQSYVDKFKAGFRHCAAEVTHFLGQVDQHTSVHVLKHLSGCIKQLEVLPASAAAPPPPTKPPMILAAGAIMPPPHRHPQPFDQKHEIAVRRPVYQNFPNHGEFANYDDSDHDMYDDDDDTDRINTPPMSPTIDVDDLPVWRPW